MKEERKENVGPTNSGCIKEECDNIERPAGNDTEPLNDNSIKVKLEDAMMDGSDAWLKSNVEMEEEKEIKPKIKQECPCDSESEASIDQSDIILMVMIMKKWKEFMEGNQQKFQY